MDNVIDREAEMHRKKAKGKALRPVRKASGGKAMYKTPKERSIAKAFCDRFMRVESGKGRETAAERIVYIRSKPSFTAYCHRDLKCEVCVKGYDFFTYIRRA